MLSTRKSNERPSNNSQKIKPKAVTSPNIDGDTSKKFSKTSQNKIKISSKPSGSGSRVSIQSKKINETTKHRLLESLKDQLTKTSQKEIKLSTKSVVNTVRPLTKLQQINKTKNHQSVEMKHKLSKTVQSETKGSSKSILDAARTSAKSQKIEEQKQHQLLKSFTDDPFLQIVKNELASKGSSSESEEVQEIVTEEHKEEMDHLMLEPEIILDLDIYSDEMSSSDDELEYIKQNKLEKKLDFLENFGKVPQVDQISLDHTDIFTEVKPRALN